MMFIDGWYLPDGETSFVDYLAWARGTKFPREYQKEARDESLSHVTKFNTAIDIGACVGFWSRDLCKRFNKTICFEPYPPSANSLIKNLQEYNNYELFNVALSNQSGTTKLFVVEPSIGTNFISNKMEGYPAIDIEMKRLDEYGFVNVDYM